METAIQGLGLYRGLLIGRMEKKMETILIPSCY